MSVVLSSFSFGPYLSTSEHIQNMLDSNSGCQQFRTVRLKELKMEFAALKF